MSTATNQNTLVEMHAAYSCHVDIYARKYAIYQDSALQVKKKYWRKDVEKDAINLGKIAIIGVKYHVIQDKSALKFHVMQKSEYIVNVDIDSLMWFANPLQ